jgi:flagellar hook-length control protein FliK
MADILTASPTPIAPGPSASRGDESRIRENSGNESGPAAPVTFAAVLKSRSDQVASGNGKAAIGKAPAGAAAKGCRLQAPQRGAPAQQVQFERTAPTDKLAVEPAISAETAGTGSLATSQGDAGTDFRSTLDRIASHSGNLALQAGSNAPATSPPQSVRVETGFGQAGWNQEMGEKLTWMVGNGRQQADLVLNPPQLGRIEVTMVIEGDNVSASFASPNAAVREALENSMSRLREVLADAGVALGNTHVGAESRQDAGSMQAKDARNASANRFGEPTAVSVEALAGASRWQNAGGRGMVDVFA